MRSTLKSTPLDISWRNKEIPTVTKDIFGNELTFDNISVKYLGKDTFVLVGDKKSGKLNDKDVVNYFMQFIHYPQYRKYIINTLRILDNVREI